MSAVFHILSESQKHDPYARSQSNLYVSILLGEILRNYSRTYTYFMNKNIFGYNIPVILAYIKSNLTHISLESLAAFFGYNKDYLGKLIFKATGKYYNEILNTYRIDKAAALLQYSSKSIAEISSECGFNSSYHFNHTFNKLKGMSASKFRQNYKLS